MSLKILLGDALEIINSIENDFDLILFDPPFWPKTKGYRQIRRNTKKALKPIQVPNPDDYGAFWDRLIRGLTPLLKRSGWLIFKADDFHFGRAFSITQHYLDFNRNIVWDKGRIGLGAYIRPKHELLSCWLRYDRESVYFRRADKKINRTLFGGVSEENAKRKWHGGSRGIALESIIHVPNFNAGVLGAKMPLHINETPIRLWERIIPFFCPPEGHVLDPFAGSGSIGAAIKRLNTGGNNIDYTGIELDRDFYNIAIKRLHIVRENQIIGGG